MPRRDPVDDIEAKAIEIALAIKQSIVANMPPEYREARTAFYKRRRETNRERWKQQQAKRNAFAKGVHERLLGGYSQAEVAQSLGTGEARVSEAVALFWSLPKPGRDYRYIVIALSPTDLAALDELGRDMLLSRRRTLEAVAKANLEESAAVARRTLQVKRRDHE